MNSPNESAETETAALIAELREKAIKHHPKNIIRIAKSVEDKIIFLRTENTTYGLQHILADDRSQISKRLISEE